MVPKEGEEIKVANKKWMEEQCQKIEALVWKYESFNLHKKVKEPAGHKPKRSGWDQYGVMSSFDSTLVFQNPTSALD